VDAAFAEPIARAFEQTSGIRVHLVTDTEAGKTTGLLTRIKAERDRPRADVWWSSEVFGTMELAAAGLLAEYHPPSAADIPPAYRDPRGRWTAYALRGRVLAYDPKRTRAEDLPRRWADVTDARWRGRFQMADPRFGTTRGHMAALLERWGTDAMTDFYRNLKRNDARLAAGNAQCVALLLRGDAEIVATDTDDVIVAQERGDSIAMIYPDLGGSSGALNADDSGAAAGSPPRSAGTLWIPCTVALIAGGPHAEEARRLADHLVSAEVEEALARSDSRNVPVRPALRDKLGLRPIADATVDYAAVAARLAESDRLVNEILLK
jgi:iron(III) transport system substrate-binding protein